MNRRKCFVTFTALASGRRSSELRSCYVYILELSGSRRVDGTRSQKSAETTKDDDDGRGESCAKSWWPTFFSLSFFSALLWTWRRWWTGSEIWFTSFVHFVKCRHFELYITVFLWRCSAVCCVEELSEIKSGGELFMEKSHRHHPLVSGEGAKLKWKLSYKLFFMGKRHTAYDSEKWLVLHVN